MAEQSKESHPLQSSKNSATPNYALKKARERRNWTQQELAQQLGTTPLTVHRWEQGKSFPSSYFRTKLCDLFETSAEDLGLERKGYGKTEAPAQQEPKPPSVPIAEVVQPPRRLERLKSLLAIKNRWIIAIILLPIMVSSIAGAYILEFNSLATRRTGNILSTAISHHDSFIDPSTTPILDDPLTGPNPQYHWDAGTCSFKGGQYHEQSTGVNYCLVGEFLKDFEYDMQFKITQGRQAGIVFRADGESHLYYFYIDIKGTYGLDMVNAPIVKRTLKREFSSFVVQGYNQSNLLAVVARGTTLKLYINRHFVYQIQDSTFTQGYIGVCVGDYNAADDPHTTTAVFLHAKAWRLP